MADPPTGSLSEPCSGFPPPDAPLLASGTPGPTDQRDFMFVGFQSDGSQAVAFGRRERIFVHKRFHQKRKQASIDRLRSRVPSNPVLQDDKERQEAAADAKKSTLIQVRRKRVSLTACPSQRFGDPFSACAMPMTGKLWMYLHDFRVHIISGAYPFDASQMQVWWAQHAINSPAVLQICACRAAEHKALLGYNQGCSSDVIQKSIKDSIYFRLKVIKTLNDLLQDPVKPATEATVLIVSAIMGNESFGANFEALRAHTTGLRTLVSMIGGLDSLDHMMLSTIYQGALMLAALQNTKPIFPMLAKFRDAVQHEPQIFHNKEIKYECTIPAALASLGTRFTTAPWHTDINPTLMCLIESFRRLIWHFEIGTLFPNVVAPTDNDLFVIIQHDLLSTHYTSKALKSPSMNEPLRQCLLIYLYIRASSFQDLPIMRCMVENLRQSLAIPALPHFYATAPDLLFWILFIGGMASQGYNSHSWFVSHLADVAGGLGLEEWAQVRALLGRFFYTDRAGNTAAEDLWSEVVLLAGSYRYIAPKPRLVVIEMDD
ncbi:hypothetical protein BJX63DRAFT_310060 [Aspergillus granulosus]|uniref:Tachykinin family protein n=1 Tax=Aspergillus granulosus TaxID=176169 RepID=A0ABR4H5D2_9EURO